MSDSTTLEVPVQPTAPLITVGSIISNSFKLGFKHFGLIFLASLVYFVTIWIPYLNVGTTIAMSAAIIIALSKGEKFSVGKIFDKIYRKNMGEFFILCFIMCTGVYMGMIFLVLPGLVLAYSWMFAFMIWLDKGMKPIEALRASNEITYGYKWTIFWGTLIVDIICTIIIGIIFYIFFALEMIILSYIVLFILILLYCPISYGCYIYLYRELSKRLN